MIYPNVSILMPTYNRRQFIPLITYNLLNIDYDKSKLELCILDDGAEPLFTDETLLEIKDKLRPLKINYKYDSKKKHIGVKRNLLVKQASYKTYINMDDDDVYFPTYIKHSIETLNNSKIGLVGTNHMMFIYTNHNYNMAKIECQAKRQIHEATMCYTKKYFNSMPGFGKSSLGEGASMVDFNEKNANYTDITKCMVCFCHAGNSFNKEQFYKYKFDVEINNADYLPILETLSGVKYEPDKESSDEEEINDHDKESSDEEEINDPDKE